MPHLDIVTYFSQIFWLVLAFVILYVMISRIFFPSIAKVVDQRVRQVELDMKEAGILTNEYRENVAKAKDIVAEAKSNALMISEKASLRYDAKFEEKFNVLEDALSKEYAKSQEKLFRAKTTFEKEMDGVVLEVEAAISEKVFNSYK